ncbi:hypothetical protein B7P34_04700 [Streptosporangium nondiastaticum]|uniref:Uncharacterized protein n=1 Tax=Streptosporangium nondiastaticum TaxID=35764 RepID=A0A9X7PJ25_9ACTN|nr:hypothetical protein [Streptosporangium nondiastaticum]PSJ29814.1 hypothetical protein B7P34_04700 [Streptosporangium nondiastaticum]
MEQNTEANVVRVAIRAHRAPGGGRTRLLAYVHTNCTCRLASTLVGTFDNLAEAEALAAGATPERFRHCTKSTPIREQAPTVEAPVAEDQEQPKRDEPSDTWTITNRAGVEIARVEGATAEDMTQAAEALPKVRATIRREGGFTRRRLWVSELTPADVEQAPTEVEAEQQPVAEVERRVVEGVVVKHAGTTEGSWPRHATHPDAIAARAVLRPLKPATLADHTDTTDRADEVDTSVRGYMVVPRGRGRVAAYWIEGGQDTFRGEPHAVELKILRQKFLDAGWRVEPKSRTCVFAWRPAEDSTGETPHQADAACQEAGRALRARRRAQQPAPALACQHGTSPRPDVSGNPVAACDGRAPGVRGGVWSDEGCVYSDDCLVDAANECARLNAEEEPAEEPLHSWHRMCPEHDEQTLDECEECNAVPTEQAEEPEGEVEVEEAPEAGGTWRSGWMAAERRVTEGALFDLGDGVEQGLLFQ